MSTHCPYSCDLCDYSASSPPPPSVAHCLDSNPNCAYWAKCGSCGDCNSNPGYMLKNCPASCGQCGGSTVHLTSPPPPPGSCLTQDKLQFGSDTNFGCTAFVSKSDCLSHKDSRPGYPWNGQPCAFCLYTDDANCGGTSHRCQPIGWVNNGAYGAGRTYTQNFVFTFCLSIVTSNPTLYGGNWQPYVNNSSLHIASSPPPSPKPSPQPSSGLSPIMGSPVPCGRSKCQPGAVCCGGSGQNPVCAPPGSSCCPNGQSFCNATSGTCCSNNQCYKSINGQPDCPVVSSDFLLLTINLQ